MPFDFILRACLIAKVQSPSCHNVNVTTWQKQSPVWDFSVGSFFTFLMLCLWFLSLCASALPAVLAQLAFPFLHGWLDGRLLSSCHHRLPVGRHGNTSLLCCPVPGCSGVVSAQHPERLQSNCPKLRHRPPVHSPEALPNVVICGWPSWESLGKWSFWLGQMLRAGKQRRDGAWGGSWEW